MGRRSNGEGSIRKRKEGRYEVRTTVRDYATGQKRSVSEYTSTREEAVKIAQRNGLMAAEKPQYLTGTITLAEWLDYWMQLYMKDHLKQSTRLSYEAYARNHFVPVLGGCKLKDITPQMLKEFYNYKATQGAVNGKDGLSPKTIINMNNYLCEALQQAVREGRILSNPAANLHLPRGKKPEIEILTREEQSRLMQVSYRHRYGFFIRLTLATGMRKGEICGLEWRDIDFNRSQLVVHRTYSRLNKLDLPEDYEGNTTELVTQIPKTENSIRMIPLQPFLLSELQQWRMLQAQDQSAAGGQYQMTGRILTNPLGECVEPRTLSDYYHQMLEMAGLPKFTFHALRHTFATRAVEQGMDMKTISAILGHASVSFTMDTYAHVLPDHKHEEMRLMADLYDMVPQRVQTIPVLMEQTVEGIFIFTCPVFVDLVVIENDFVQGQRKMQLEIQNRLAVNPYVPDIGPIVPAIHQTLLQIPV